MSYLFTSESVSEGHPDKVSDQIADAILDEFLKRDINSKVACEVLCTTGLVVISGEVKSEAYVDIEATARKVIRTIGYNRSELMFDDRSCGLLSAIHEQSPDINQGVEREDPEQQGAGDQGIMFGYATNETSTYMPATLALAHQILITLSKIRHEGKIMTYLRPDAKSQVTIEYSEDGKPVRVHTIVVSTQHDDWVSVEKIKQNIMDIVIPEVKKTLQERGDKLAELIDDNYILHVNPTGKFVIGGPAGDTGVTGRKIIVDTYGGRGAHGGGAFSGKDPSKVDRSAAYALRHIAKNMVAAGISDEVQIQIAYAIGLAQPVSLKVDTFGKSHVGMSDSEISEKILSMFDLKPASIIRRYGLKNPIFHETAAYGHFGREPFEKVVDGKNIQFFSWEKLDEVDRIKEAFSIR